MNVDDFNNEKLGNAVEWRVIGNTYRADRDSPRLFVYRVRVFKGKERTEYLHRDGSVSQGAGIGGFFRDYVEVGKAFAQYERRLATEQGVLEPAYARFLSGLDDD